MKASILLPAALCLLASAALASDFTERAKTQGISTTINDRFGIAVSTDGEYTVVGAIGGESRQPEAEVSSPE